jgi:hypothetical protein
MVMPWSIVESINSIEVDHAWLTHSCSQLVWVSTASPRRSGHAMGLINTIKVIMQGKSNGCGQEVTQHC